MSLRFRSVITLCSRTSVLRFCVQCFKVPPPPGKHDFLGGVYLNHCLRVYPGFTMINRKSIFYQRSKNEQRRIEDVPRRFRYRLGREIRPRRILCLVLVLVGAVNLQLFSMISMILYYPTPSPFLNLPNSHLLVEPHLQLKFIQSVSYLRSQLSELGTAWPQG